MTVASSYLFFSNPQHCENAKLNKDNLNIEVKKKIDEVNRKLKANKVRLPNCSIVTNGQGSGKDEVHGVHFSCGSGQCNTTGVLSNWLKVLSSDKYEIINGKDSTEMSFISDKNDSSIKLQQNKLLLTLSIFRDGGFTLNDVDNIAKGYEKALEGYMIPNNSRRSESRNIPEVLPFFEFDSSSGIRSTLPANDDRSSNVEDSSANGTIEYQSAVRDLNSLGMELYNADKKNILTWDALAGYDDVKQEIRDSILTYLQHSVVYESVTSFTRHIAESNRPKAVLLEGPPGTGNLKA